MKTWQKLGILAVISLMTLAYAGSAAAVPMGSWCFTCSYTSSGSISGNGNLFGYTAGLTSGRDEGGDYLALGITATGANLEQAFIFDTDAPSRGLTPIITGDTKTVMFSLVPDADFYRNLISAFHNSQEVRLLPATAIGGLQVYLTPAARGEFGLRVILEGVNETPGNTMLQTNTITAPAPVPEPATIILLGLGIVGLGIITRFRKHRTS